MKIGLVLGGGGAKGSFQAGVIEGLLNSGYEITAITGTSVGALNGALTAIGKVNDMISLWRSINKSNTFYPNYNGGKTYGMIFRGSLYSNQFLRDNINTLIDPILLNSTEIYYGCVSSDLISSKSVFKTNCNNEDIRHYILASASLPPAFPPINIAKYKLVDGGLTSPIPVSEILQFENVEMDKIIIIPSGKIEIDYSNPDNFIESNLRVIDVMYNSVLQENLEKGIAKYWSKNKLFAVIEPEVNLISTLECDPNKISAFIAEGYKLGKNFQG